MDYIKSIISLILFFIFFVAYISKLIILYKRDNIKANVLAKGDKPSDTKYIEVFVKTTTFIWGAVWLSLSLAEVYITKLVGKFIESALFTLSGIILTFVGIFLFLQAITSMKASWRVGIDKISKTKLVTNGIYKYSRNPAFVGFDFMFIGLFLMYPSFLTLLIFILNILAIHLLILQEEKHLISVFSHKYLEYCKRTPRYFIKKNSTKGSNIYKKVCQ